MAIVRCSEQVFCMLLLFYLTPLSSSTRHIGRRANPTRSTLQAKPDNLSGTYYE